MFTSVMALFIRILSNPFANMLQKVLAQEHSAILINLYSYAILSLFCLFPALKFFHLTGYGLSFWLYVALAGILCTLGSVCLIKALQYGEMSVLGPINSYKCIVGLLFAIVLLGEIPSCIDLLGVILIIYGSRYIFDTTKNGFDLSLFKRKDISLRFLALLFTGCEAVILKKIILLSSVGVSFILWCFSGLLFSVILSVFFKVRQSRFCGKDWCYLLGIAFGLGVMQLSTNYVFEHFNVGLSLALFQLSGIVSVFMGWKVFREGYIKKKILGSLIMIIGSCFILLR